MLFNFARKTKPLGLAASQKVKAIALSWPAYPDGAHKQMWVYRYTSLAIANADTPDTLTTGTRIAQTVENATVDSANLVIGANQFYRALSEDIYGNRSALSDVLTVKYTGVADLDTDQSPPNIPSVVLASYTGDIDDDDTIDTGLTITITAPTVDATHPKAVRYVVQLWKSATSDGVYVFHKRYFTDDLVSEAEVPQKWFYKAIAKAISFSGKHGAFSTLPVGATGTQPAKYLGTIPTPSTPAATPIANGVIASFDKPTFKGYKETIVFVGGIEIHRTKTNFWVDQTIRTPGASYTYTYQHVDIQGRVGLVSTGAVAIYRGTSAKELSILDLLSNAENNDMSLGPNVGWSDPANIVSDVSNAFRGTYVGKRAYTGAASSYVNRNKMLFPVRAGEKYYIGGMVKTDGSFAGASAGWRLSFCSDYAGVTEIATSALVGVTAINTVWTEYGAVITVPSTAGIAYARLEWAVYSQTAGAAFFQSGFCRPEASKLIDIGSLTDDKTTKTPPGTPGVPALSTVPADVDLDGHPDVSLTATWTAPAYSSVIPPARTYELEVYEATTIGGVYSFYKRFTTSQLAFPFVAKANRYYKASVTGISYAGVFSAAYSALTTTGVKPLTPVLSLPAPTGVSVVSYTQFVKVKWTAVNRTTYPSYAFSRVYYNYWPGAGPPTYVLVGETASNFIFDTGTASGVADDEKYYTVIHYDTSGQETARSTSTGAANTRTLVNAEYGYNTISTSKLQSSSVTRKYNYNASGIITITGTNQNVATDAIDWSDSEWLLIDFQCFVGTNSAANPITVEVLQGGTSLYTFRPCYTTSDYLRLVKPIGSSYLIGIVGNTSGGINIRMTTTAGQSINIYERSLTNLVLKR